MTSRSRPDRAGRNWWLALPATVAAGALGVVLAARGLMRRPVPRASGRAILDGVTAPVEVYRDEWGVPHIYAANESDLFFAQGFTHAQDRLFQMDFNRRLGLGRLAELAGPLGLPFDKFARYLGWPRAARAQTAIPDDTTRAAVDAYSAGVNAFIATQPLPVEYRLLTTRPEPWDALATSAWGTVLAWGLSCNWETELLRAWLMNEVGPERAIDLTPVYGAGYLTTLPDEAIGRRLTEGLLDAYRDMIACGPVGLPLVGRGLGSNNWVVSGARTASGRPQLANDPHLPPVFPTIWYANHLAGGGYDVTGFTLPGVPGVVIGHNTHCAWGLTNAFPDVQDVYVERFDPNDRTRYEVDGEWRPAEIVEETISVRRGRPVRLTLRSTHRGPVFSDILPGAHADLSYNWTLFHTGSHLRAALLMNRATDWSSFREGLRLWSFPSQNVVYADTGGTIAYMMPGVVPRRRKGNGLAPVPGWVDDYDWDGFLPFEELPTYVNPPEGFVATANNCMAGDNYPHLLTGEWLPDYRVRRIRQLLDEQPALTLDDHRRIQNDTFSLMARRFLAAALPVVVAPPGEADTQDALNRLAAWDKNMAVDSVAATLYFGWQVHFTHAAVAQALGAERADELMARGDRVGFPFMPFYEISFELALRWLEGAPVGSGRWNGSGAEETAEAAATNAAPSWVGDVRPLLLPALRQTLDVLRREVDRDPQGWVWGRVHRVFFQHEMARLPGVGRLWKPVSIAAPGDGYSVNQSDLSPHFPPSPSTIIASCRLIVDVGAWDNSLAALPGGQSGHPASPHYQDRIAGWRAGEYFPLLFSREKVLAAARGMWRLEPMPPGAQ